MIEYIGVGVICLVVGFFIGKKQKNYMKIVGEEYRIKKDEPEAIKYKRAIERLDYAIFYLGDNLHNIGTTYMMKNQDKKESEDMLVLLSELKTSNTMLNFIRSLLNSTPLFVNNRAFKINTLHVEAISYKYFNTSYADADVDVDKNTQFKIRENIKIQ